MFVLKSAFLIFYPYLAVLEPDLCLCIMYCMYMYLKFYPNNQNYIILVEKVFV